MPKRTIQIYLLLTLMRNVGIALIAATYVIFLISQGFNLFQIGLINFTFFATLLLFEVPTGVIADVFGRKKSFIISCFLLSMSMFLYSVAHTFSGFIFAEVIGAIGVTFATGAFQAWLVDTLKYQNYTESLRPVFIKEQQITYLAGIFGAIAGAFLADIFNISILWIMSGTMMMLTGIVALVCMKEVSLVHKSFSFKKGLQLAGNTIKTSIHYGIQNKAVRFILLIGVLQSFAIQAPNMQWQPLFFSFLPNKTSLGFILSGMSICFIIGSTLSSRFLKLMRDEKRALVVSQIGIGFGIFAAVLFDWFPFAIIMFLLQQIARGIYHPIKDVYFNNNIPSNKRATLISFQSMSYHLGAMIGLLFSGFFAEAMSIRTTWMVSGGTLIVMTLLFVKMGCGGNKGCLIPPSYQPVRQ